MIYFRGETYSKMFIISNKQIKTSENFSLNYTRQNCSKVGKTFFSQIKYTKNKITSNLYKYSVPALQKTHHSFIRKTIR